MRASLSRNERCECGSGKKYKHCCLRTQRPIASSEVLLENLIDKKAALLEKIGKLYFQTESLEGSPYFYFAWSQWCVNFFEPLQPKDVDYAAFLIWYLLNFAQPDKQQSIAQYTLQNFSEHFSSNEQELLRAWCNGYSSFFTYSLEATDTYLEDLLSGRKIKVIFPPEFQVSKNTLLFARIFFYKGLAYYDYISPIAFNLLGKSYIFELRQSLRKRFDILENEYIDPVNVQKSFQECHATYRNLKKEALEHGYAHRYSELIFSFSDKKNIFSKLKTLAPYITAEQVQAFESHNLNEIPLRFNALISEGSEKSFVVGCIQIQENEMRVLIKKPHSLEIAQNFIEKTFENSIELKNSIPALSDNHEHCKETYHKEAQEIKKQEFSEAEENQINNEHLAFLGLDPAKTLTVNKLDNSNAPEIMEQGFYQLFLVPFAIWLKAIMNQSGYGKNKTVPELLRSLDGREWIYSLVDLYVEENLSPTFIRELNLNTKAFKNFLLHTLQLT